MARLREAFTKAPILDTLIGSQSKRVRNSTMELICSSLDIPKEEFKSTLLSDLPKYRMELFNIEQENRIILLSWVDLLNKEKRMSWKKTLINGGVYPIIISVLVVATFLFVTNLIFSKEVSDGMREPLLIVVGALASNFSSVVQFFLGSSLSNISKENTIRDTLANREQNNRESSEREESQNNREEE